MKKILLSAAALAIVATSAYAEDPRVHAVYKPFQGELTGELSPDNFVGARATAIPSIATVPDLQWQIPVAYIKDNFLIPGNDLSGGHIAIAGPAIQSGADTAEDFTNGFNLVDLGGSCGKTIVINGHGSNLQEKLGGMGVNVELKQLKQLGGMPVMFWIPNPNVFKPLIQGKTDRVFRCSIEYNLYHNNPGDIEAWQNVYINDDQNDTPGATNTDTGVKANMSSFYYTWVDKATDESLETDWQDTSMWYDEVNGSADDDPVWNPERWLVTEFDFPLTNEDFDGVMGYAPRLKWEFKPGFFNNGGAVLIRGIYFSEVGSKEAVAQGTRSESWKWHTMGAGSGAGVENVATDFSNAPVEYFNLQGVRVNNPENGIFICRQGNKVTKVVK